MALINFTEIPDDHTFELFAREFFEKLKLHVEDGPDVGPDGGRDIIVTETRTGILGSTAIRWLVSCKHYAVSSKAIGDKIEYNISDRVHQHSCDAFLGFYSTSITSGLNKRLKEFSFQCLVLDHELIERYLLEQSELQPLIPRFFPVSWKAIDPEYLQRVTKKEQSKLDEIYDIVKDNFDDPFDYDFDKEITEYDFMGSYCNVADGAHRRHSLRGKTISEGTWKNNRLIQGTEYAWLIEVTEGRLIFKPDCPDEAYDSTENFEYTKYEQAWANSIVKPFECLSNALYDFEFDGKSVDTLFVVDMIVEDDIEQMTNIRPIKEYLIKEEPKYYELYFREPIDYQADID